MESTDLDRRQWHHTLWDNAVACDVGGMCGNAFHPSSQLPSAEQRRLSCSSISSTKPRQCDTHRTTIGASTDHSEDRLGTGTCWSHATRTWMKAISPQTTRSNFLPIFCLFKTCRNNQKLKLKNVANAISYCEVQNGNNCYTNYTDWLHTLDLVDTQIPHFLSLK